MFAPVDAVPAEKPKYGTLVAAAVIPADGARWQQGVSWRPERCAQGRTFDPCDGIGGALVGEGFDGLAHHRPTAFRIEDTCSTLAGARAGDVARVRRQAEAATSYFAARELETGERTRANPYRAPEESVDRVNDYLASADAEVIPGEWSLSAGLGMLEQTARQAVLGQDVFVHMPIRLAEVLMAAGGLVSEGSLIRTRTGARVVADTGYSGVGPFAAGTSEVQTVMITGGPTGGTFTVTYGGQTTAGVPFNGTAAALQTAINNLSSVDGVTVSGVAGGPYTVTFPAALGNVAQMTASGAGLTGGTAPAVNVATVTPGVAPAFGDGVWMYATGPVTVRLDDVYTDGVSTVADNTVTTYAERLVAAYFDPCGHFAIQVADPAPTP